MGLYTLLFKRKLLNQPGLYLGIMITVIIISPILIWNIQNHFMTFNYHGDRVAVHQFSFNKNSFLQAVLGQFFYNNPVNTILIFIALFSRKKTRLKDKDIALFFL